MHTFNVTSGQLRVTDPCYDMTVWCAATIDNVRNGLFHSEAISDDKGVWGERISELLIYHDSVKSRIKRLRFQSLDYSIGVDSGQAGFFDKAKYEEIKINEQLDTTFYNEVMELTLSNNMFGVVDFGVVSSSGYGDGVYSLQVAHDNGEIVAAKIIFITEDNDDYQEI